MSEQDGTRTISIPSLAFNYVDGKLESIGHQGELYCRKRLAVPSELDYVEDKSMWFQLFGTPEKAAEYFAMQCLSRDSSMCYYCPFNDCDGRLRDMGAYPSVYNKILEWLRGDA
jgi:hypothetical protein